MSTSNDVSSKSSAKPIEISPERKDAFCEFILSLPRKCSPTICGIIQLPGNEQLADQTSTNLQIDSSSDPPSFQRASRNNFTVGGCEDEVPMETSSFFDNQDSLSKSVSRVKEEEVYNDDDSQLLLINAYDNDTTTTTNSNSGAPKDSIWSIDEWSELYGADFDNVHELEHFHEYEETQLSAHFEGESRRFFSQPSINPSPVVEERAKAFSRYDTSEGEEDKENISRRSTASFIRYIDTLESIKTSEHGGVIKSVDDNSDYGFKSPSNFKEDDQLDSGNFHEQESEEEEVMKTARKMKRTPKRNPDRMSFVESTEETSDFLFSSDPTSMDISFDFPSSSASNSIITSSGGGFHSHQPQCGGLSKFESTSLQLKYNEYFDFSPISPISRRTPTTSRALVGSGKVGGEVTTLSKTNAAKTTLTDGVFKTPSSSKQRTATLQRTKLFNEGFESTPTVNRLNFNM